MDGPVRGREFGHLYTAFILPLSAPAVHMSISLLHDPSVCLARHLSGDSILSIYIFGFYYFLFVIYVFFSCSFFFFIYLIYLFICLSVYLHIFLSLSLFICLFFILFLLSIHIFTPLSMSSFSIYQIISIYQLNYP